MYVSLQHIWDDMTKHEIGVWAKFNHWWLTKGIPILAVRYEDILAHPEVRFPLGPPALSCPLVC
jgi:hypothetical protein